MPSIVDKIPIHYHVFFQAVLLSLADACEAQSIVAVSPTMMPQQQGRSTLPGFHRPISDTVRLPGPARDSKGNSWPIG